jgi:P-type E1-E2 ATPase
VNARSVIVYRSSPAQKAQIVQLIRSLTSKITLAVGDGSNDIAMI